MNVKVAVLRSVFTSYRRTSLFEKCFALVSELFVMAEYLAFWTDSLSRIFRLEEKGKSDVNDPCCDVSCYQDADLDCKQHEVATYADLITQGFLWVAVDHLLVNFMEKHEECVAALSYNQSPHVLRKPPAKLLPNWLPPIGNFFEGSRLFVRTFVVLQERLLDKHRSSLRLVIWKF